MPNLFDDGLSLEVVNFNEGLQEKLDVLIAEIQHLYLDDEVPWIVGYSGGKDSSAIVQLIWMALEDLDESKRHKDIHVISTDTMVENPIVALWVKHSLDQMRDAAIEQRIPVIPHPLKPKLKNTFWVNLIGRGYPAPRQKFRWCTDRLKIQPSNDFINDTVKASGEALLVLGTRKAESAARAANMKKHELNKIRDRITPNATLPNCWVYTPIEAWTSNDVWAFLHQCKNPWGISNQDLQAMYAGATEDNECPIQVDTSAPSCGNSRFGCWVCTLVDQDKSLSAMVQNDEEKRWMKPLLDLRNELDFRTEEDRERDRSRRQFRRLRGNITYYTNKDEEFSLVKGPYTQESRAHLLGRVLETQKLLTELGPEEVKDLELITKDELELIRRMWVIDKHEIEDLLPRVYEEKMGTKYDGVNIRPVANFNDETFKILAECAKETSSELGEGIDEDLHFELVRNLLTVEDRFRTMVHRQGLFKSLEKTIRNCFYDNEDDALERGKILRDVRENKEEQIKLRQTRLALKNHTELSVEVEIETQ